MFNFRLRLRHLPSSMVTLFVWLTASIHLAIHVVLKEMNGSKILNSPAKIRSINQTYFSLISKNGDKHLNYASKAVPTVTSLPKINCTNTIKKQIVTYADMILICHYWKNPFQIIWAILIYLDHALSYPSMKGNIEIVWSTWVCVRVSTLWSHQL